MEFFDCSFQCILIAKIVLELQITLFKYNYTFLTNQLIDNSKMSVNGLLEINILKI